MPLMTRRTLCTFLSTPSARRATPHLAPPGCPVCVISIHALREEGDICIRTCQQRCRYFYPRPPRGGRRPAANRRPAPTAISIHALREEGDLYSSNSFSPVFDFYPRPPRGGRQMDAGAPAWERQFLSTPSARRATQTKAVFVKSAKISIHALREEGDKRISIFYKCFTYFYPRPPRGGRRHLKK